MNKEYRFITISIVLLVFFIVYSIFSFTSSEIKYIDKNKDIVYKINNDSSQNIPFINLVGEDIDKINSDIINFTKKYADNENVSIGYDYNKNGSILSVLITIINRDSIDTPEILFNSYNINLSNNKIINDDELLEISSSSTSDLEKLINNAFIDYYNNSGIQNYCDYNCFLQDKNNYYSFNKDVSLYLNNNKLYAYINMNPNIEYIEYQYFEDKNFSIKVGDIHE